MKISFLDGLEGEIVGRCTTPNRSPTQVEFVPKIMSLPVDTQFFTHDLIKENDLNDQFMYPKNHNYITCINSFISYHENDLEVLMVATICPVPKSDCQIKRYRMIKFARSICIVWGEADHM